MNQIRHPTGCPSSEVPLSLDKMAEVMWEQKLWMVLSDKKRNHTQQLNEQGEEDKPYSDTISFLETGRSHEGPQEENQKESQPLIYTKDFQEKDTLQKVQKHSEKEEQEKKEERRGALLNGGTDKEQWMKKEKDMDDSTDHHQEEDSKPLPHRRLATITTAMPLGSDPNDAARGFSLTNTMNACASMVLPVAEYKTRKTSRAEGVVETEGAVSTRSPNVLEMTMLPYHVSQMWDHWFPSNASTGWSLLSLDTITSLVYLVPLQKEILVFQKKRPFLFTRMEKEKKPEAFHDEYNEKPTEEQTSRWSSNESSHGMGSPNGPVSPLTESITEPRFPAPVRGTSFARRPLPLSTKQEPVQHTVQFCVQRASERAQWYQVCKEAVSASYMCGIQRSLISQAPFSSSSSPSSGAPCSGLYAKELNQASVSSSSSHPHSTTTNGRLNNGICLPAHRSEYLEAVERVDRHVEEVWRTIRRLHDGVSHDIRMERKTEEVERKNMKKGVPPLANEWNASSASTIVASLEKGRGKENTAPFTSTETAPPLPLHHHHAAQLYKAAVSSHQAWLLEVEKWEEKRHLIEKEYQVKRSKGEGTSPLSSSALCPRPTILSLISLFPSFRGTDRPWNCYAFGILEEKRQTTPDADPQEIPSFPEKKTTTLDRTTPDSRTPPAGSPLPFPLSVPFEEVKGRHPLLSPPEQEMVEYFHLLHRMLYYRAVWDQQHPSTTSSSASRFLRQTSEWAGQEQFLPLKACWQVGRTALLPSCTSSFPRSPPLEDASETLRSPITGKLAPLARPSPGRLRALLSFCPPSPAQAWRCQPVLLGELQTYWKVHREAEERARRAALKKGDVDAYAEHINMLQITALLEIMERTHQFMHEIGQKIAQRAAVKKQKQEKEAQERERQSLTTCREQKENSSSAFPEPLSTSSVVVPHLPPPPPDKEAGVSLSQAYQRFKTYLNQTKNEFQLIHAVEAFVPHPPATLRATLLPHQMDGLRFLASLHANDINGILADEMGVGKTIQTLAFLLHLKETEQSQLKQREEHIVQDSTVAGEPLSLTAKMSALAGTASSSSSTTRRRPHLVLAPLSVVREWAEACDTFLSAEHFRVAEFLRLSKEDDEEKEDAEEETTKASHASLRLSWRSGRASPAREREASKASGHRHDHSRRGSTSPSPVAVTHRYPAHGRSIIEQVYDYDLILLPVHSVRYRLQELKQIQWSYIIIDEAHKAVANLSTITAQNILQLPFQRRLVLTGTPLSSNIRELWSLLYFLNPDVFSNEDTFDNVFQEPFKRYHCQDVAGPTQEHHALVVIRLHQILRPFMLRRTKRDVCPTLRRTFHHLHCPLTAMQEQLLSMLRNERKLPIYTPLEEEKDEEDEEEEENAWKASPTAVVPPPPPPAPSFPTTAAATNGTSMTATTTTSTEEEEDEKEKEKPKKTSKSETGRQEEGIEKETTEAHAVSFDAPLPVSSPQEKEGEEDESTGTSSVSADALPLEKKAVFGLSSLNVSESTALSLCNHAFMLPFFSQVCQLGYGISERVQGWPFRLEEEWQQKNRLTTHVPCVSPSVGAPLSSLVVSSETTSVPAVPASGPPKKKTTRRVTKERNTTEVETSFTSASVPPLHEKHVPEMENTSFSSFSVEGKLGNLFGAALSSYANLMPSFSSFSFPLKENGGAPMVLACSGKLLVLHLFLTRVVLAKRKAVLFTHWLDMMDLLDDYFQSQGWGRRVVMLSGATDEADRKRCVQRFHEDPDCSFFVVSMKAGGCGINLQCAHLVLLLDRDYTTTNEDQALARVFRIGQRHTVRAISFCTNDVSETKVMTRAVIKNRPRQAIIEEGKYLVGDEDNEASPSISAEEGVPSLPPSPSTVTSCATSAEGASEVPFTTSNGDAADTTAGVTREKKNMEHDETSLDISLFWEHLRQRVSSCSALLSMTSSSSLPRFLFFSSSLRMGEKTNEEIVGEADVSLCGDEGWQALRYFITTVDALVLTEEDHQEHPEVCALLRMTLPPSSTQELMQQWKHEEAAAIPQEERGAPTDACFFPHTASSVFSFEKQCDSAPSELNTKEKKTASLGSSMMERTPCRSPSPAAAFSHPDNDEEETADGARKVSPSPVFPNAHYWGVQVLLFALAIRGPLLLHHALQWATQTAQAQEDPIAQRKAREERWAAHEEALRLLQLDPPQEFYERCWKEGIDNEKTILRQYAAMLEEKKKKRETKKREEEEAEALKRLTHVGSSASCITFPGKHSSSHAKKKQANTKDQPAPLAAPTEKKIMASKPKSKQFTESQVREDTAVVLSSPLELEKEKKEQQEESEAPKPKKKKTEQGEKSGNRQSATALHSKKDMTCTSPVKDGGVEPAPERREGNTKEATSEEHLKEVDEQDKEREGMNIGEKRRRDENETSKTEKKGSNVIPVSRNASKKKENGKNKKKATRSRIEEETKNPMSQEKVEEEKTADPSCSVVHPVQHNTKTVKNKQLQKQSSVSSSLSLMEWAPEFSPGSCTKEKHQILCDGTKHQVIPSPFSPTDAAASWTSSMTIEREGAYAVE